MGKADNQVSNEAASRPTLSQEQLEENSAYIENWSTKYAAQIAAYNEMVERNGLWSDGLRSF